MDDDAAMREQKRRDRRDGQALAAAQRHLDEGRLEEARALLAEVGADPSTPIRAHAALLYAGVLLMTGRLAELLEVLARLPERPSFPFDEGYRRMIEACALRQLRRYDEALLAARQSVAQGLTTGRLLVLADAQKHAGQLSQAVATLEHLLARDAGNTTALAQLAGYMNLLGASNEAERAFQMFLACAEGSAEGSAERSAERSADAHRNAAFVHATRGDLDATMVSLDQALAREPEVTRSYIADEVEFDRFRSHPLFLRLLAGRITTDAEPRPSEAMGAKTPQDGATPPMRTSTPPRGS